MKILFLHGWHSVPGGVKPTSLRNVGYDVIDPKLDDDDFAMALQTAQANYDRFGPDVIVGSSRGGAVAMNIDSKNTPLVLLCPAWKRWGSVTRLKKNAVILHSRQDDVIPFEDSQQVVAYSNLPQETLIEVGNDHRLADVASLSVLEWACRVLASGEKLTWSDAVSEQIAPGEASLLMQAEATYVCDACGEQIVVPLDISGGRSQQYVEDCPVCCRANVIHVSVDDDGFTHLWAEPEQDNA